MKQFILFLLAFLSPVMACAESYGWFEVDGRRVNLNYAYVTEQNGNLVSVIYSDKDVAPYLSNHGLVGKFVFSGLLVEYNLECKKDNSYTCLNEFQFVVSATPLILSTEIEDIKDVQPDMLWGGEVDFDNKDFVYTKTKLSASGKNCPVELWYRGRTEVNTTSRISFNIHGYPSNWKR